MIEPDAPEHRLSAGDLYHALQTATSFGVGIADGNRRLLHVNDGLCKLLGRPAREIAGKRIEDFRPPASTMPTSEEGDSPSEKDQCLAVATPPGDIRCLSCCWQALGSGDPHAYTVTVFDITDRMRLTATCRSARSGTVIEEQRKAALRHLVGLLRALCDDRRPAATGIRDTSHRRKKES